jgi:hypothetical protein
MCRGREVGAVGKELITPHSFECFCVHSKDGRSKVFVGNTEDFFSPCKPAIKLLRRAVIAISTFLPIQTDRKVIPKF